MVSRGFYDEALHLLRSQPDSAPPEDKVHKLAIEASALSHQEFDDQAEEKLAQAAILCAGVSYASCGQASVVRGVLAVRQRRPSAARDCFLESISFAQARHDKWLETNAEVNLGWAAIQFDHFDEAKDWSRSAYKTAQEIGSENLAQAALGNLGWAYFQLGDDERALEQFLEAKGIAEKLGNVSFELNWISTAGYVYRETGDLTRATESYRQAFDLARQLDSKGDIENSLEDLAKISVDSGKLDKASGYIDRVTPMELADGGHLSANVLLTEGMLAAALRQDRQAESLFRAVQDEPKNPTTTRLGAGEQLARLYELEGNIQAAEQTYKATLTAFDSAQAELKSEESKLPFVANAARIYDDYIHLLVGQGRSDEALEVADHSRARTLAQALGADSATNKADTRSAALSHRQFAPKAGATLLFYWLGERQSYLWAITPRKAALFPLPARAEIEGRADRYRKALLDLEDPLDSRNEDGQALYNMLVAPAAKLIRSDTPVMILADGALSQLNFETLLVPGPGPNSSAGQTPELHYWIDDATLLSAPSIAMIAAAKPAQSATRNLLLLGDPITPSDDFPSLPLFGFEMKKIQSHFDAQNVAVFAGPKANPAAYLSSNPARYSYIHFVSHAVSSRTDPLDSAIILSNPAAGADSFKLYARDIMRRPLDARLVTISACYGSGTRTYAGEGLVGLSWAFLRAGAHSVIGALWAASDDSSPRLMDSLYQGLEGGQTPAAALRHAKLALLHSAGKFRLPFFWAPFQIYTRQ